MENMEAWEAILHENSTVFVGTTIIPIHAKICINFIRVGLVDLNSMSSTHYSVLQQPSDKMSFVVSMILSNCSLTHKNIELIPSDTSPKKTNEENDLNL